MTRRATPGLIALFLGAASGSVDAQPLAPAPAPEVVVESGRLAGSAADGIVVFKGVPYAKPPVGPGRWAPPALPEPWTGTTRDATQFGPACPQGGPAGFDITQVGGSAGPYSEDCLNLNVWAPARLAAPAPVMVWIHGGSNRMGAGSLPFYDGSSFARDGVVLVTINYRLGALGFFAHPALTRAARPDEPLANYGLIDQIAALQWVRRNISAFGGDPANITVFGESAGGVDVLTLLTMPSAKGLFAKAVVESGGGWFPAVSLEAEEKTGASVATAAGLPGAQASADQLRALPVSALVGTDAGSMPITDGRLLKTPATVSLLRHHAFDIPLMIGTNSGEDSLAAVMGGAPAFVQRFPPRLLAEASKLYGLQGEALARALFRDLLFTAPARWTARMEEAGAAAYLYRFSRIGERLDPAAGAQHGAEIFYVFETLDRRPDRVEPTASDQAYAQIVHAEWVAFAKTGVPAASGAPTWPAYHAQADELMEFGQDGPRIEVGARKAQLDWLEGHALELLKPAP